MYQNYTVFDQPVMLTNDRAAGGGSKRIPEDRKAGGFTNLQSGVLTGGTYETNPVGTDDDRRHHTAITVDAADIIMNGTGSELSIKTSATLEPLETSLATIAAGGIFSVTGGRSFTTTNVITNDGTIIVTGGSTLTVGGFVNDGTLELDSTSSFVNTALTNTGLNNGGVLRLSGGTYSLLGNVAGATVEGSGVITGAVANDGTIVVTGGTLQIDGAVTGAGGFVIDPGAELAFQGSDAQTVAFAKAPDGNGGGELLVGNQSLFTANVAGLTSDDTFDFSGANITADAIAGTGGGAALNLTLEGGHTFSVPLLATAVTGNALPPRYDGNNGTQMTLLPIAADSGQYASTVPGVSGGKDLAPSFTIVYGATPITAEVPVTSLMSNEGVNWFLDFPSLPAGRAILRVLAWRQ